MILKNFQRAFNTKSIIAVNICVCKWAKTIKKWVNRGLYGAGNRERETKTLKMVKE